eukprot:m.217713 g.217713  ORF g.217713 m.217713 type:complete len:456 (-) comp15891_c0_seq5:3800-5167(-)
MEEKLEAQEYLRQLGVLDNLQIAVNSICREKPDDPYALLCNQLSSFCLPPKVNRVHTSRLLVNEGLRLHVQVFATSKGRKTHGESWVHFSEEHLNNENIDADQLCNCINTIGKDVLEGMDPREQDQIDEALKSENIEYHKDIVVRVLSQAVLSLAASGEGNSIHGQLQQKGEEPMHQAMVVMPTLRSTAAGKCNIKCFNVCSYDVLKVAEIYKTLKKQLVGKHGMDCVLGDGTMEIKLDKVEQGLDIIKEAALQTGMKEGSFFVILDCDIPFNASKKKYEIVSGGLKSPTEVVDVYVDIAKKYSTMLHGYVNPMPITEKEALQILCDSLCEETQANDEDSSKLVGHTFFSQMDAEPDHENEESGEKDTGSDSFPFTGVIVRVENEDTITDLSKALLAITARGQVCMLDDNGEYASRHLADLTVGLRASYLRVIPNNTQVLNRLFEVYEELNIDSK